jgi:cobalt-zinc-cadmium efflux system protein
VAHHHHHHHHHADADERRLAIALALICALIVGELLVAAFAHSLAVFSDAAHMVTDALALAMALLAARLARRPASGAMTYGLGRAEILSALANGITLLVLGGLICAAAVQRLVNPPQVHPWPVLAIALVGVAVNLVATRVLAGGERRSLNVEGAYRHILTDLFAFAATAVAAVVIIATGYVRADAIASLLIAAVMVRSGAPLVVASVRVFLEAAPPGIDPDDIGRAMVRVPSVTEVHDLHVWEVTSGFPALSAHVLVGPHDDCHAARRALETLLRERFEIGHTTLQVEHEGEEKLLQIDVTERTPRGI